MLLDEGVAVGLGRHFSSAPLGDGPYVTPTQSPEHGDYQCNCALALAQTLKKGTRHIALTLLESMELDDMCLPAEIVPPGFVNFRLRPEWVAAQVRARLAHPRVGVDAAPHPRTIVVDFSSPNVARPMHVGHIRSTIIGDALVRLLRFLGHRVIADNHLGDWGTRFGMVLLGYRELLDQDALAQRPIAELRRVYRVASERCQASPEWLERAHAEQTHLRAGSTEQSAAWNRIVEISRREFDAIYARLGVTFDCTYGESFYNPMLPEVVHELEKRGLAREDQGAQVVFFQEPEDLRSHPYLVRKKDGGYLYSTTDLATVKFRMETFHPDSILYVTDGRQQLHFRQLFQTCRLWGYQDVELEHVSYGTVLGADNRPIRGREGEPVELEELLDEAEQRALTIVREKQPELSAPAQREIARVVGIGAVKYADLSQNRASDYVFSWEKMLAMQGNTGPYLQYAYARTRSILDRAGVRPADLERAAPEILLETPGDLALAKTLLRYGDAVHEAATTYRLNTLTSTLFEVATSFTTFFENCPVLQSAETLRSSRLALCHMTARTLEHGLGLLGIAALPRM